MVRFIKKISVMSDNQIRNEVSRQIAKGAIGKLQLNYIIKFLEKNRPEIFNNDNNGFVKIEESQKWDKAYLHRIHNAIVCGYFCKEILFHMEKVIGKLLLKYKIGACGVGLFLLFLVGVIWFIISSLK